MKNVFRGTVLFAVLILFSANIFAYRNYYDGIYYSAGASYICTTEASNIYDLFLNVKRRENCDIVNGDVQKLSKNERACLWGALREYDYARGEIYIVTITSESLVSSALVLFVEITGNDTCNFKGYIINYKNLLYKK